MCAGWTKPVSAARALPRHGGRSLAAAPRQAWVFTGDAPPLSAPFAARPASVQHSGADPDRGDRHAGQAPVPRRPRRQPAPPARAARGAREGEARRARRRGAAEVEDRCIREAVAKQEAIGLEAVTDGEFRRDWWHLDFLAGFDGVDAQRPRRRSSSRRRGRAAADRRRSPAGSAARRPIMVEHFAFLKSVATKTREVHHPLAVDAAPARRHERHLAGGLPRPGRVLGRPRRRLPRDDRGARGGRLHLSPARRHHASRTSPTTRCRALAARTATTRRRCTRDLRRRDQRSPSPAGRRA